MSKRTRQNRPNPKKEPFWMRLFSFAPNRKFTTSDGKVYRWDDGTAGMFRHIGYASKD